MSSTSSPLETAVSWLAAHAGFPASRLPAPAETLVLMAAAAEGETTANPRFLVESKDPARNAALKAHAMRRSLVHYKCDNGAKV